MARQAWEKHGTLPADLFARLTPRQFVAVFTRPAGDRGSAFDRVAALQAHNDERGRKGLRPAVPAWV